MTGSASEPLEWQPHIGSRMRRDLLAKRARNPVDREFDRLGYDIESRIPGSGRLRFIEVKGRVSGAATLSVTRNEILSGFWRDQRELRLCATAGAGGGAEVSWPADDELTLRRALQDNAAVNGG